MENNAGKIVLGKSATNIEPMKLIKYTNFEITIADELLLVKPFRKLFNQDRSQSKEQFFKLMSVMYFTYAPDSNYSYIIDEEERLKTVLEQEDIKDFKMNADFKAAVEVYKQLTRTTASELLADVKMAINKVRQVLNSIDFDSLKEKEKVDALNTVTSVIGKIPKLVRDLSDAERAVAKEQEEQNATRGQQQLSITELWAQQNVQ